MFTRKLFRNRKTTLPALVMIFMGAAVATSGQTGGKFRCLSAETNLREKVSPGASGLRAISLEERLTQLRTRCSRKRLVDSRGREIRIFRRSCWGNPPADYLEILGKERRRLTTLKRKYTVIEIGCDTSIASMMFSRDRLSKIR